MKTLLAIVCVTFLKHLSAYSVDNCVITNYSQVDDVIKRCKDITIGDLIVPGGKTLKLHVQDDTTITVAGNVSFEHYKWLGPLVEINGTRLTMTGIEGSVFDGRGPKYWDGLGEWGSKKPEFFHIKAFDSTFKNLELKDSPRYFILLSDSDHVTFTHMVLNNQAGDKSVTGPGRNGHNTDGFDVWNSTNIIIKNSQVFNQDDCIALRCGQNIYVSNLFCHGGNGFSLSVGFSKDSIPQNTLKNVTIEDSEFVHGGDAIHVKTHVDGGKGSISDVVYRNIWFDVYNYGIVVQQDYRNLPPVHNSSVVPPKPVGNIPITNLRMENVAGIINPTTNTTKATLSVMVNCASKACSNWKWNNVNITGKNTIKRCNYKPEGFKC